MNHAVTIFLDDYQPYPFNVLSVYLDFSLYDDYAIIVNEMQLEATQAGELRLSGKNLECLEIILNGQELLLDNYYFDQDDLVIEHAPKACTIKITTKIRPQENSSLSGLYRSNALFCTQCEAEGFRRITFRTKQSI